jgi:hypothetical protein
MLVVALLLPLSSSMYDSEFDHSGGGGGGGGSVVVVVVAVVAVAAVEGNYWCKRPATRALMVT